MTYIIRNNELYHHGIKGQRWGVRRFQNEDGSLKPAGEKRYSRSDKIREARSIKKAYDEHREKMDKASNKIEETYWNLMNKEDKNGNYIYEDPFKYGEKFPKGKKDVFKAKEYVKAEQEYESLKKKVDQILKGKSLSEIEKTASMKTGKEIGTNVLKTAGTITLLAAIGIGTAYAASKLGK